MRGILPAIFLIIICLAGILSGWLIYIAFYNNYFAKPVPLIELFENNKSQKTAGNETNEDYPEGMLFYNPIRFQTNRINFSIDNSCSETKKSDAIKAFNILDENTVLEFSEVPENGQIKIHCSDLVKEISRDHFIAGEGGPGMIINTTKYFLIIEGDVLLYKENTCENPIIAIHEILHVLGFKHSSDKSSIMYEISDCNKQITEDIISKIQELYLDLPLADLSFNWVNATKTGGYLDFEAEIINIGLKNVKNITLTIIADEKIADKQEIGGVEIGAKKIVKITNLKIPRDSTKMVLWMDKDNSIPEFDKLNNRKELILKKD
ncbi:MAG: matrixin family metalloprotease [Candidatus Pacearchaeota archaeon]